MRHFGKGARMTIHKFQIKLQRSELGEPFVISNQEIDTDILFKSELLYAVEKLVNRELFSNEVFRLTAEITVDTKLHCIDKKLTMSMSVTITEVLNFDEDNILLKPLTFVL